MAKVRVYELAKKLGIPAADLLEKLKALGEDVASNFSSVDEAVAEKLAGKKAAAPAPKAPASSAKTAAPPAKAPEAPAKAVAPKAPAPAPKLSPAPPPAPARPSPPRDILAPGGAAAPHKPKTVIIAPPTIITGAAQKGAVLMPPPPKPVAPPLAPSQETKALAAKGAKAAASKAPAEEAAPAKAPVAMGKAAKAQAQELPAPVESAEETIAEPKPVREVEAAPEPVAAQALPTETQPEPPVPQEASPRPPARETRVIQPAAAPVPAGPPQPPAVPRPPVSVPRPPVQQPVRPQPPVGYGVGPAGPRPQGAAPYRPQRPYPGRPAPDARRGPVPSRPPAQAPQPAPARPPEPQRPAAPSRLAPQPEVRRKTKRERRIEKLQAKVDRRERLEQELVDAQAKAETGEAVFIREGITVKELADKLNVKVKDIIAKLMMRSILVTINQPLDAQVAIQVSSMFGFSAEVISFEDELVLEQEDVPEEQKAPRAPVVTVMGHVDHGKSSLLEAIHDVDITGKEFGGITQHIGAYRVHYGGREYVFLDTPGHEAFTLMRARGAQVTDIVILVVAADDGVMPQTIEAINHCKAANVPMVVAMNKMDKPGADPDRVKRELSQQGILTEDWGGTVVSVPISAKTRLGIEELLEMISIVSDMLQLEASPESQASGTVLESKLDRSRGPVATVLIQDGSLKVGDLFLCGSTYGHVRGMFDDKGERVDYAGPSTPIEILGFSEVPAVGALFQGMTDEAKARQIASFRKEQEKAKAQRTSRVRLENVFGAIQQGEIQELPLILKADVHGSLEAIAQQVKDLSTDEIKVNLVHQGVGAVSESDVLLASASNALIIGFNVRPERKATDLAKSEGVDVHSFTVIYDLIDRLKQALTGMLKPIEQEVVLGHAEIKEIFKVSKVGTIAGCVVADGRIPRAALIRVLRDNVVVYTGKISSLKRFKDDASEVKEGLECGIGIENFNDVKPGDVLEAFEIQMQERTL